MTDESQDGVAQEIPPKAQFLPLYCPACQKSAYNVDHAMLGTARSLHPDMIQRTDPNALEPALGYDFDCPYCGNALAIPQISPVIGGGYSVKFRFLAQVGVTK